MAIDWKPIQRDILQRINIRGELESLGVRFTGETRASGWAECFVVGSDESRPSAAIRLISDNGDLGLYKNSISGETCSFWQLTADLGVASDWKAARQHFADKVGVELPKRGRPKKDESLAKEVAKLKPCESLARALGVGWEEALPGVSIEALLRAQPRVGDWFGVSVFGIRTYVLGEWDKHVATKLRRFDGQQFSQKGKLQGKSKCVGAGSGTVMLFATPEEFDSATDVVIFEGETDGAAWAHVLPPAFVAISPANGASDVPKNLNALRDKRVWIAGDSDKPGQQWRAKLTVASFSAGVDDVQQIDLPYPVEEKQGKDARDYRAEGHTWEDLAALAKPANKTTAEKEVRQEIIVDIDQERIVNESIVALIRSGKIFQRNGRLVQIVHDARPPKCISSSESTPRIVDVPLPRLLEILTTFADFIVESGGEEGETKLIRAPRWVAEMILARGMWPAIPPIEGVVHTPIVRSDGSILDTTGYDEQTGLFYSPQIEFPPVPASPTLEDVTAARDAILECVSDFPFKSDEHRAAWFAAAIGPTARHAVAGPYPLFVFDANAPGSGKTLAADLIGVIHAGAKIPRTTAPVNEAEMAKTITSIALAGERIIFIDNVTGQFGGASIDACLTGTTWTSRILGESKMSGSLTLSTIWFVSANNISLSGDTSRRTIHIRLETDREHPEERSGFTHPDLSDWVQANRGRLATACCIIFKAFFAAKCPKGFDRWGSFEAWSDIVRGATVWVGLPDPVQTRVELRKNSDRTTAILRQLLTAWKDAGGEEGMTSAEAVRKLQSTEGHDPDAFFDLRAALAEISSGTKPLTAQTIGKKLHSLQNRICDGLAFIREDDSVKNVAIWVVREISSAGSTGSAGSNSIPKEFQKEIENSEGDNLISKTKVEGVNTTPVTPGTPGATDKADCEHDFTREVRTQSGAVRIECVKCRKFYGYKPIIKARSDLAAAAPPDAN